MRRLGHQPALDGLRGLAILLVVAHHTSNVVPWSTGGWLHGGALGVDLFFVLSGFLITTLLLNEWDGEGRISLRAFYVRRARRLLPAVCLLVGVIGLVMIALHPHQAPDVLLLSVARLSYAGNFLIAFGPGLGTGFIHLWSLAQEEQFYLLWPPVLIFLLRRRASPNQLLLLLGGLIVAVNVDRLVLVAFGAGEQRLWYAPDTHGDAILFGCAAAIIYVYKNQRTTKAEGWQAVVIAAPILVIFRAELPLLYPLLLPLFDAACAVIVLSVIEYPRGRAARALSVRPLRGVGKVSYGLYLWHVAMLDFFGIAGLPIAVAATVVSYLYVERLFIRRSGSPAWIRVAADLRGRLLERDSGGAVGEVRAEAPDAAEAVGGV